MSTLVLNLYVLYYNETENINEIDLINMNLFFFFNSMSKWHKTVTFEVLKQKY